MKRLGLLILALGAIICLNGCTSVDFSLPSGFSHGAKKDIIRVKFTEPFSNVQLTAGQKNQLVEIPKTTLIRNKRFVVLSGSKGDLTGTESYDFEVRPYVDLAQVSNQAYQGYGCLVKLDVKLNDKAVGAYEDGFTVKAGSKVSLSRSRFKSGGVANVDWNTLFSEAYNKALIQMDANIKAIYPICGTVIHIKNKAAKTEFTVDRGTNFGISKNDEFVVYYVDQNDAITPVAIAKGMIGREKSQVTVIAWNNEDSEVRDEILPRIKRNDKTLLGNLFVVCRPEKKK